MSNVSWACLHGLFTHSDRLSLQQKFHIKFIWWTHIVDEFGKSLLNLLYLYDHISNIIIIISAIVTYYLTYMMFINSQLFTVIIIIFQYQYDYWLNVN